MPRPRAGPDQLRVTSAEPLGARALGFVKLVDRIAPMAFDLRPKGIFQTCRSTKKLRCTGTSEEKVPSSAGSEHKAKAPRAAAGRLGPLAR